MQCAYYRQTHTLGLFINSMRSSLFVCNWFIQSYTFESQEDAGESKDLPDEVLRQAETDIGAEAEQEVTETNSDQVNMFSTHKYN